MQNNTFMFSFKLQVNFNIKMFGCGDTFLGKAKLHIEFLAITFTALENRDIPTAKEKF